MEWNLDVSILYVQDIFHCKNTKNKPTAKVHGYFCEVA